MNINVYIEDSLGKEVTANAKALGKTRNAIVREALKEWLQHHKANKWPKSVLQFEGVNNFPEFESYRDELNMPDEDPFK
ncbi:MAG: ribbon-helix-helix domain-containing protein [Coxiellaceae bacterium]|nr:ribbon-helix-helix domain-containing protein [Coxiellaceae bacterium]